jgi:1,5-anhydro-D-fructose reductase (1,5-anhydro-D-mannitol-forming)
VRSGVIGEPQLAHVLYAYPAKSAPRKWIADPTLACGGPIADVGVHCMDALRYVLEREISSVTTLARTDEVAGTVDAVASLQLEMTGGVYASVSVSARAAYRTLLEVTGSDGVLTAENGLTVDRPVELVLRRAGQLMETATVENGDGYVRMLDSFAAAYRGEGTFAASGEDGVRNMRALDAAYKSWRSGARELV